MREVSDLSDLQGTVMVEFMSKILGCCWVVSAMIEETLEIGRLEQAKLSLDSVRETVLVEHEAVDGFETGRGRVGGVVEGKVVFGTQ